jgi:hypothetical protein
MTRVRSGLDHRRGPSSLAPSQIIPILGHPEADAELYRTDGGYWGTYAFPEDRFLALTARS